MSSPVLFRIATRLLACLLIGVLTSACGGSPAASDATPGSANQIAVTVFYTPRPIAPPPTAPPLPTARPAASPRPAGAAKTVAPAPPSGATATIPPPSNVAPSLTISYDFANVRSGPGQGYDLIGKLDKGQTVAVKGKNSEGDWWQIDFNGGTGWVFGELTQANAVANNVPAMPAPPLPTQPPQPTLDPAAQVQVIELTPVVAPNPLAELPTQPPPPTADPTGGCNSGDPNWRGKGNPEYQFCVWQDLEWVNGNTNDHLELKWNVYGVRSVEMRIEGGSSPGRKEIVPMQGVYGFNRKDFKGCFKAELYITRFDGKVVGYNEKFFCGG